MIFGQELARLNLPVGINVLGIIMTGPALMQWGTEEQKNALLEADSEGGRNLVRGHVGAGRRFRPGRRSRPAPTLQGDSFIVNGQKIWTTHAHRSHFCQLFVRTDFQAPKHKGLSALLVDMKAPGVTVRPLRQITGEAEFNEIFFEDVRVPRENLLGPLNGGWQVLVATLMHERFGIGETLGASQQTLAELVELAKAIDYNGAPAIENAAIRQQLAQFAIEAAAKKYNGMRSLTSRLKGLQPGPEASISKLVSTELTQRMVKFATHLLGQYALIEQHSALAPSARGCCASWLRVDQHRGRHHGGAKEHDRRTGPAATQRLIRAAPAIRHLLRRPLKTGMTSGAACP